MPFQMNLWQVNGTKLSEIKQSKLDTEERLENWIAEDPGIAGLDLLIIGRQVVTEYGGRIDLLGIDSEGDLAILELKRDRTSREIVAQILDYASWVKDLTYQEIDKIATGYLNQSLVVGVKWLKTFPREEAKTFRGVFANQNVVCKLRHPETVQFVKHEFEVSELR